jgi:hypothetical protein
MSRRPSTGMILGVLWILVLVSLGVGRFVFPFLVRAIFVPLGWVRAAHFATRWPTIFRGDGPARALFYAAWAHLRSRRSEDRVWIEARLAAMKPLGGSGIATRGLLAIARDDDAQARTWLRSLEWVHGKLTPALCIKLAREWLAADAASRGAWGEVVRLAGLAGPATRATRLLGAVAMRMTRGSELTGGSAARFSLWARWLLAPQRRAFLPLVRQALAAPPPAPPPHRQDGGASADGPYRSAALPSLDPLQRALAAHARVIVTPSPTALADAVSAWDDIVLALPPAMRDGALRDLATLATTHRLPIPDGTGFTEDLRREVRHEVLGELETVARALESRVSAGRIHDAFAEWSTFLELRRMYDEAGSLAGREAQRLVYARVHDALCPLAVVLWNDRKEHPLAHAMFRWLLDEARLTEHTSLVPHEERNAACRF